MNFQFHSLSEFAWMAGHGPYVWASYAVMALAIVWLLVNPLRARRQLLREVRRQQRIAETERQPQPTSL